MMMAPLAQASQGLTIHALEFGVGKFHRADNQAHAYDSKSSWAPYILGQSVSLDSSSTLAPLVVNNADGSVTIFFATLDDLIAQATQASKQAGKPISVLNVHGHGLPGAMWFPATTDDLNSGDCSDWKSAATGSDQENYDQYYSPVADFEITQIREVSNMPEYTQPCTTGLKEWTAEVAKAPDFKAAFAADAQIHFLSCVVGLGSVGDTFTQGIADLLLQPQGKVEASMNFGLGDWSMPQGMGFWDMQNADQLDHDNTVYPQDRKDAEIAQKGTIRVATPGQHATAQLADRDFMLLSFESMIRTTPIVGTRLAPQACTQPPATIRVPGTTTYLPVVHR
jgi:hypothetical protein